MALQTSDVWKRLRRTIGTHAEYKWEIAGQEYGPEYEVEHSIDSGLFEEFSIGQATCAHLTISLFADSIPRGAKIERWVRLHNSISDETSEWLRAGIFWTNRRSMEDGYWTIDAYDVMRKAEQPWEPDQSLEFPLSMKTVVDIFCGIMDCELDPRTSINPNYSIDYPTSDPDSEDGDNYTMRQILQWIAAAHGGNWIVTAEGKLLLVPMGSEPEETFYLVCEHGDPINFGGAVILVE